MSDADFAQLLINLIRQERLAVPGCSTFYPDWERVEQYAMDILSRSYGDGQ